MSQEMIGLSKEQFKQLMAAVVGNSEPQNVEKIVEVMGKEFMAAIQEMKKPTTEEQEKIDEDKKRREQQNKQRVELAKAEVGKKKIRMERCPHLKQDGRTTIGGQIIQDGLVHPICVRCQSEFAPFKPTPEMMMGGVNLMA